MVRTRCSEDCREPTGCKIGPFFFYIDTLGTVEGSTPSTSIYKSPLNTLLSCCHCRQITPPVLSHEAPVLPTPLFVFEF